MYRLRFSFSQNRQSVIDARGVKKKRTYFLESSEFFPPTRALLILPFPTLFDLMISFFSCRTKIEGISHSHSHSYFKDLHSPLKSYPYNLNKIGIAIPYRGKRNRSTFFTLTLKNDLSREPSASAGFHKSKNNNESP